MSHELANGRRELTRQAARRRVADEAARLVLEQGIAETTVEQIADAAHVGRASVFRYFETKEGAVAEGLTAVWLQMMVEPMSRQPPELGPIEAVRSAFGELAQGFHETRELILSQAQLSRSSAVLSAWTLQVYLGYEAAIARAVAPRFGDVAPDDPRPRLVGVLVMAAIRLALDDWVATGGTADLPALIDHNLAACTVT